MRHPRPSKVLAKARAIRCWVRILLQKLSDDRHVLKIVRHDGRSEEVECETRSYLAHDLLHYAVEGEARLDAGFWGNLARGKTLAQMNDRTGASMKAEAPELMAIERVVGALSGIAKGVSPSVIYPRLRESFTSAEISTPAWLTEEVVSAVQDRMRRVLGHWKATPYGASMVLPWPP